MITYSVAALLLAYLRAVQAQATICLATYGGVVTRYVFFATELTQIFLELLRLYIFWRADLPV